MVGGDVRRYGGAVGGDCDYFDDGENKRTIGGFFKNGKLLRCFQMSN